jgi:hypothetical protein
LDDVLRITGGAGLDTGSARHDFVFWLDDRSFLRVVATYDKKLVSIEHQSPAGFRELLRKP